MVRFVHYQQRGQLALVSIHQKRTEQQNQFVFGLARYGQSEIARDITDKLQRRQARIENISKGDSGAPKEFQNAAHQHGLACAHFAGQDDKALARPHSVVQRSQSFVVARSREQERRVRCDLERVQPEVIESLVHSVLLSRVSRLSPIRPQ